MKTGLYIGRNVVLTANEMRKITLLNVNNGSNIINVFKAAPIIR